MALNANASMRAWVTWCCRSWRLSFPFSFHFLTYIATTEKYLFRHIFSTLYAYIHPIQPKIYIKRLNMSSKSHFKICPSLKDGQSENMVHIHSFHNINQIFFYKNWSNTYTIQVTYFNFSSNRSILFPDWFSNKIKLFMCSSVVI